MTTVLFSTHILSDVERVCTNVAFLNGGRIAVQGTVSEIRAKRFSEKYEVEPAGAEEVKELMGTGAFTQTGQNTLVFSGKENELFEIMNFIAERKIPVQRIERLEPSLEELFLEVAGK